MNYQSQIDEILDYIDFNRIETAMTALNWRWQDLAPDIPTLRQRARQLLHQVSTLPPDSVVGTGGFSAYKDADSYLCLSFALTEWNTNPNS